MPRHVVKQGECLSKIAQMYGFQDARKIYDHPENSAFKEARPNPDLIYPGDVLFIPELERKQIDCATGQRHKFVARARPKKVLRLVIHDVARQPMAGKAYTLVVDGTPYEGTSDDRGMIEQEIDARATEADLEVEGLRWTLQISHLNPMEDAPDGGVSGAQARLRNLGWYRGEVTGEMDDETVAAIRAFQEEHALSSTSGALDEETRARLAEEHGC